MPGIHGIPDVGGYNNNKIPLYPHRVQDKLQLQWRLPTTTNQQPSKLMRPYDVLFWNDDVVVAEGFWPFSRIQIISSMGKRTKIIGQGQILPFGMALTHEGHLVVTDHHDRTIKMILKDSETILSWKPKMFNWPNGVALDHTGNVLVTDWADGMVYLHDCEGHMIHAFSTCDGTVERSCPEYITQDTRGRLLLTDTYDHTVKVFSNSGQLLFKFGEEVGPGRIGDPRGIAVDAHDNIVVADWGSNMVKKYSSGGVHIEDILLSHQIQHPWGLALDGKTGNMALTEQKLKSSPALKLFKPAE